MTIRQCTGRPRRHHSEPRLIRAFEVQEAFELSKEGCRFLWLDAPRLGWCVDGVLEVLGWRWLRLRGLLWFLCIQEGWRLLTSTIRLGAW